MIGFLKSKASDIEDINRLVDKYERQFAKEFMDHIRQIRSDLTISKIKDYLEENRPDLAVKELEREDSTYLSIGLSLWFDASNLQTKKIQEVKSDAKNFDPTTEDNGNDVRYLILALLLLMRKSQEEAFAYLVWQGNLNDLSIKEIAAQIGKYAGLTIDQIKSIQNYEQLLRQGSKEALNRALRDKDFDERLKSPNPLTEVEIRRMVRAYEQSIIQYRNELAAKLLVGDLTNSALESAAKKAAGYDVARLVKEWRSVRDRKVRFTHKQHTGMDGQVVGIDDYFQSPSGTRLKHPHDGNAPLKETANCRCRMLIYLK